MSNSQVSEIVCKSNNALQELDAPTTMSKPFVIKTGGDFADLTSALTRQALERYTTHSVQIETPSGELIHDRLGNFLRIFDDDEHSHYVKSQLVSELDPKLHALVPAELRKANWLASLPSNLRPDWLWILIGTAGSQSPMHVDTTASSAWNFLASGEKNWVFHPPAWSQCEGLLPALRSLKDSDGPSIHFRQAPGDIVFTPSGWAHSVTNHTRSIAITGNFLNCSNIDIAIEFFSVTAEPGLASLCEDVKRAFNADC